VLAPKTLRMTQAGFVERRKAAWERLDAVVSRAARRGGAARIGEFYRSAFLREARRSFAYIAVGALSAAALALYFLFAGLPADAAGNAAGAGGGCGVSAGTLTMLAADNDSDFSVVALYDARGTQVAQQFIPLYSPDASAELMLTQRGFGTAVATVRCLADSSLRRCPDARWAPLTDGLAVSLAGVLLGPDWIVVSIKAHYVQNAQPAAVTIDGTEAGFGLDAGPTRWSALYDSQNEAAQAFYGIKGGEHTLTIGSRDSDTGAFVPQDRLCFST
jgi:hypothetical protein